MREEIVVARGNFRRAAVDGVRALTHAADGFDQLALHVFQAGRQHAHFVAAGHDDLLSQVAGGDLFDVVNHAVQRAHQDMMDAGPGQYDHRQHHHQNHDQRPNGRVVGAVAAVDRDLIQLAVLLQINVVALLKVVLVALRRLIEEGVNLAFAQQLDQFGERAVQNVVLLLNALCRLGILTRILRDFS